MIPPKQVRDLVVAPVLAMLAMLGSVPEATELLLATAMQESGYRMLVQEGGGPALGLWQMEPATHDDLWTYFLAYKPGLAAYVSKYRFSSAPTATDMIGNLYYGCAMARMLYYRAPGVLPAVGDYAAQAQYYLVHYNAGGKATAQEYIDNWHALQALLV